MQTIVVRYDSTDRATFDNVACRVDEIAAWNATATLLLVGGKCDADTACVTEEEGRALAAKHYFTAFFPVNTALDVGVTEVGGEIFRHRHSTPYIRGFFYHEDGFYLFCSC
jgi:GTPase SAR1 family protein